MLDKDTPAFLFFEDYMKKTKFSWTRIASFVGLFLWTQLSMYVGFLIGHFYEFTLIVGMGVPVIALYIAYLVSAGKEVGAKTNEIPHLPHHF
ncbi:MAG: hypothetical protein KF824_01880 [Fimbriimonadaceae bacterium]|nr:MAG: hypothetical protein KF824_01880 [Fimbriimonadaceae bacterium]